MNVFVKELIEKIDATKNAGYKEMSGRLINKLIQSTLDRYREYSKDKIKQVVECLRSNEEVRKVFDNKFANAGNVRYPVGLKSTAIWLVNQSYKKDTSLVVQKFMEYVESGCSKGLAILALSGIEVDEQIIINEKFSIVPFSDLIESSVTEALDPPFLKLENHLKRGYLPQRVNFGYRQPKTALLYNVEITPQTYNSFDEVDNYLDTSIIYEVYRLLTLVDNSTPVILGDWFELDDSVPFREGMGKSYSLPIPDVFSPKDIKLTNNHQKIISNLITDYFNLTDKYRKLLKLPIERLNVSRRRKNNMDRAIDLGIAYESLFLTDNPRDEMSFTLRKRVSTHLSKANYESDVFETIRSLYQCRSDSVHTGEVHEKYNIKNFGKIETDKLLSLSDKMITDSIKKIIKEKTNISWWN